MFSQAVVNKDRAGGGKEGRKRHLSTMTTNNLLSVRVRNISEMIYVLLLHMCCGVICVHKGLIKLILPHFRETYLFIIVHIQPIFPPVVSVMKRWPYVRRTSEKDDNVFPQAVVR